MKPINWIVLAVLAVLSIVFVSLYFMLGFNLVDWPSGLVLGIIWWAAIIVVGVSLFLQKRHFDKQDGARDADAQNGQSNGKTATAAKKVPVGSAIVTAILVPTLALCPYFSTNFSYADEPADKAASSSSAAATSDASAQPGSQESAPNDVNDPWHYMLSPDSTGVYLMYSIKGSSLKQLEPGEVLSVSHQDAVEFFVRPKTGYLTDSTFLHSGNEHGFVTPTSRGTYSKVGTNELPGFADAVKEALEAGCTKEFHYSYRQGGAWRPYSYREFKITIRPFVVKASFDLNGGTIDGEGAYNDPGTYYGQNVEGHPNSNIIHIPEATPEKDGYDFTGWTVGSSDVLEPAGGSVDIADYWRYLYDNSNDSGATLPIVAQWKQEDVDTDKPTDTPSDTEGSTSGSDSSSSASSSGSSSSASSSGSNSSGTTESDSGLAGSTVPDEGDSDGSDSGSGTVPDATDEEPGSLKGSPVTSQGTVTGNPGDVKPAAATTATGTASTVDSNPMSGDVAHGLKLAAQQRTAGTLAEDTPFKDGITAGTNALRDGIYMVEDLIIDDPVAMGYGISYANRGCWVCDYLKAGIVITLLYGAIVLVYRAARRGRTDEDGTPTPTSTTTVGASAA